MSAMDPTPATGALNGATHLFPVRVYYEDTDAGGIVYHASYLRFAERGRTEMLRALGIELSRLKKESGLIFVVNKADMQYRKSAALDDRLVVETTLKELSGASVRLAQSIHKLSEAGERAGEVFEFDVQVACVNENGKPARLPASIREKFSAHL
jgi:acyl-CoA thioester hydrolase